MNKEIINDEQLFQDSLALEIQTEAYDEAIVHSGQDIAYSGILDDFNGKCSQYALERLTPYNEARVKFKKMKAGEVVVFKDLAFVKTPLGDIQVANDYIYSLEKTIIEISRKLAYKAPKEPPVTIEPTYTQWGLVVKTPMNLDDLDDVVLAEPKNDYNRGVLSFIYYFKCFKEKLILLWRDFWHE